MYIISMHASFQHHITLSSEPCFYTFKYVPKIDLIISPQAAPKTPKRLDATALRADRSEIPIPYLRVGKRDAEVDAPVMYDMGPDARYGRDVRRNHLHIEL